MDRMEFDVAAIDLVRATVVAVCADEDLHQGGLAGAVPAGEGVDLPAAEVGVVLSGTSTVREHVQRLGRILRPKPGKRAVLYELVTAGTMEERVSDRRNEHDAYR